MERPPPTGLYLAPGSVRAFPFVVERSIGVAQPSSLKTRCTFHVRLAKRSGLSTRKKTLFDNGVNAPFLSTTWVTFCLSIFVWRILLLGSRDEAR